MKKLSLLNDLINLKSTLSALCVFTFLFRSALCNLRFAPSEVSLLDHSSVIVKLSSDSIMSAAANINLTMDHPILTLNVSRIQVSPHDRFEYPIKISAIDPGYTLITANINVSGIPDAFVRVTIERSGLLVMISGVVGWIYFTAWSVSFYPQIYHNWKRKSVEGLNFDYICLNVIGFILYSFFNCGLYWIPEIEAEYFRRNPRGLNPVLLNDVVFSVHAVIASVVILFQYAFYERGDQTYSSGSTVAKAIMSTYAILLAAGLGTVLLHLFHWIDFLYLCSYIKLSITLIKYVPQAYTNYKRKSTSGWSIGNVIFDFIGGMFSMLQMIINAYNFDDWASIFGDPTKFGLGLFSVLFDIFFLFQHYILYWNANYQTIEGVDSVTKPEDATQGAVEEEAVCLVA